MYTLVNKKRLPFSLPKVYTPVAHFICCDIYSKSIRLFVSGRRRTIFEIHTFGTPHSIFRSVLSYKITTTSFNSHNLYESLKTIEIISLSRENWRKKRGIGLFFENSSLTSP